MKLCPNDACPHRRKVGSAAEFHDEVTACSDCGEGLVDAPDDAPRKDARPAAPTALWRRLAVTLLAPLVLLAVERIPLPGVDVDRLDQVKSQVALGQPWGILAMGLAPFLSAFFVVELAALVVPAWRPLRLGGPSGRAKLMRSTVLLALGLCLSQSWGIALVLGGAIESEVPALLIVATLTTGTLLLLPLAQAIGRYGLASGFAVLTVFALVRGEVTAVVQRLSSISTLQSPFEEASVLFGVVLLVGVTLLALGVSWDRGLRSLGRAGSAAPVGTPYRAGFEAPRRALRLRVPASGLAPITYAASILVLPFTLEALGVPVPSVPLLREGAGALLVEVALVVATGLLFARLFNSPRRIATLRARLDGRGVEEDEGDAARAELRRAQRRTLSFLVAAVLIAHVAGWSAKVALGVVPIALVTGLAMDIVAEWRARLRDPELVAVWPEHRPYALDVALAALDQAGIRAHARGEHHRALLQFFGPFVPIEIMVAPGDAEEATRVLGRVLLPREADFGGARAS